MNERRDYHRAPATGEDSATVLDEALVSLGRLRNMGGWVGDAGVDLHLLMSLLEEAKSRVAQAVADARDQEYSWAEIADLLGVTRASAWQRYAGRTEKNHTPVED
jgi:DNA-directed RNA polymerase specialized sigma24 family protein